MTTSTLAPPIEAVPLDGTNIRLEPMTTAHLDALVDVGLEPELWKFTQVSITNRDEMKAYMDAALEVRANGTGMPYVTILKSENKVIGSTRFANYDRPNRRVEIGWTWLSPRWQRTGANWEAKLLMLTHAFEVLGLNRVEFKTDSLNVKSRTALAGIGAKEEGTLRRHMVVYNGRLRDSVYFSVIRDEWPEVRDRLVERLKT